MTAMAIYHFSAKPLSRANGSNPPPSAVPWILVDEVQSTSTNVKRCASFSHKSAISPLWRFRKMCVLAINVT